MDYLVYIVCALLVPVINKTRYGWISGSIMILLLVIFQILCTTTDLPDNRILYCSVFTVIPYGLLTWLGYYYSDMSKKTKWILFCVSVVIFVLMSIVLGIEYGNFVLVSDYKYPAQLYYLSYSIPFIFLLFEFLPRLDKYQVSYLTQFISKSSLWIYLWHILALYMVKMFIKNNSYWWLQYILIVLIAVLSTWVQNKIIDLLFTKTKWKFLKFFKG